mmetsp:Transcript_5459/g.16268  ORF Transcript_5459/g.16268 Transcript_5459/m.16268 type:complete len:112 (-) Transcript_5459:333-668(-)
MDMFRQMLDDSNINPQRTMLNHLVYELLVPFSLESRAIACGFGELQLLLRKYWLPDVNESSCPKISQSILSILRQIYGYHARSDRRNLLAIHYASPSLKGIFGRSVDLDAL